MSRVGLAEARRLALPAVRMIEFIGRSKASSGSRGSRHRTASLTQLASVLEPGNCQYRRLQRYPAEQRPTRRGSDPEIIAPVNTGPTRHPYPGEHSEQFVGSPWRSQTVRKTNQPQSCHVHVAGLDIPRGSVRCLSKATKQPERDWTVFSSKNIQLRKPP